MSSDDVKVRGYDSVTPSWPYLKVDPAGALVVSTTTVDERWNVTPPVAAAPGPFTTAAAKTWLATFAQNVGAVLGYLMVFDQAAVPVVGDVPIAFVEIGVGEVSGLGGAPYRVLHVLHVASSATADTYTPIGAPNLSGVATYWNLTP